MIWLTSPTAYEKDFGKIFIPTSTFSYRTFGHTSAEYLHIHIFVFVVRNIDRLFSKNSLLILNIILI